MARAGASSTSPEQTTHERPHQMKPFCSMCKSNEHNTVDCPKVKSVAPEHVRRNRWVRLPQPSSSSGSSPSPPASSSSSQPSSSAAQLPVSCPECQALRLRVAQLEARLTKAEAGVVIKSPIYSIPVTPRIRGTKGTKGTKSGDKPCGDKGDKRRSSS